MKKVHANRTIGLQNKEITQRQGRINCPHCNGTGEVYATVPNLNVRNINATINDVEICTDCPHCDGGYILGGVVRIARKKKKTGITTII